MGSPWGTPPGHGSRFTRYLTRFHAYYNEPWEGSPSAQPARSGRPVDHWRPGAAIAHAAIFRDRCQRAGTPAESGHAAPAVAPCCAARSAAAPSVGAAAGRGGVPRRRLRPHFAPVAVQAGGSRTCPRRMCRVTGMRVPGCRSRQPRAGSRAARGAHTTPRAPPRPAAPHQLAGPHRAPLPALWPPAHGARPPARDLAGGVCCRLCACRTAARRSQQHLDGGAPQRAPNTPPPCRRWRCRCRSRAALRGGSGTTASSCPLTVGGAGRPAAETGAWKRLGSVCGNGAAWLGRGGGSSGPRTVALLASPPESSRPGPVMRHCLAAKSADAACRRRIALPSTHTQSLKQDQGCPPKTPTPSPPPTKNHQATGSSARG